MEPPDSPLPEPLVPSNVDLGGYGFMPLYGHRLFGSNFNSMCTDAEWRAGVTLWWKAWNQIPAASLPDDDASLARLADLGRDVKTWRKLREHALHGFVLCNDGRLYHKALAPLAIEAWQARLRDRARKARWRAGRNGDGDGDKAGTGMGTERGCPGQRGEERILEERKKDSDPKEGSAPNVDFKAMAFGPCLSWVAAKSGKSPDSLRPLIGRWCRDYGEGEVLSAIAAAQREAPVEPVGWITARLAAGGKRRHGSNPPNDYGGIIPMHPGLG